jgi:hypothetical protein
MPDDLPAPIAHAPSQAIGDLLMLDVRRLRILHAVNEYGSVTPGASSRSAGVVATVSPRSGSSSTPGRRSRGLHPASHDRRLIR